MKFIFIAKKKDVSFFPIGLLIALLGLVFAVLYFAFPDTLLTTALKEKLPSVMRLNYLSAYHARHPERVDLLLRKLGTKIKVGHIQDIDKDIALFKAQFRGSYEEMNAQVRWFEYLVIRYRISKSKINDADRFSLLKEARILRTYLAEQPLRFFQFQVLAQDALASGQAKLALEIYLRLFKQNRLIHLSDLEEGASIALQNNKSAIAADFYQAAFSKAKTFKMRKKFALACMKSFWGANDVKHALAWGLALPQDLNADADIQLYLSRLALANNKPALGERYLYRALNLPLNDDKALNEALPSLAKHEPLLLLLYQSSLYNKRMQLAYRIARVGVEHYPNSLKWHQQLAQTALWSQNFNQSMREWLYIFNRFPQPKVREEALKMAKLVGFEDVVIRMLKILLKENPRDIHASVEMAYAYNRQGEPKTAIKILSDVIVQAKPTERKNRKSLKRAYALKASVYSDIEQWKPALKTYEQYDKLFGFDAKSLLAQAQIYLNLKQYNEAERVLKTGMRKVSSKNVDYWHYLGNLSWRINDRKAALVAYEHYVPLPDSLIQQIALNTVSNPKVALEISLKSFKKYQTVVFLGNAMTLIAGLHQWPSLIDLLQSLTPSMSQKAQTVTLYWKLLAQLYGIFHDDVMQTSILRYSIQRFPESAPFKVDLFWFYINQGRSDAVKQLLRLWYPGELEEAPGLWQAMAEGWNLENQMKTAISLYQNAFEQAALAKHSPCQSNMDDPLLKFQQMVDYASLLQKDKDEVDAYNLRASLWSWLQEHHTTLKPPLIPHHLFEQLAPVFDSGTVQWWLTLGLLYDRFDDQSLGLAVNWFLQGNYIDWVVWMKHTFPILNFPDRIKLAVALYQNDTQTLQDIQAKVEQTKPRTEHIQAAIRLENTAQAEKLLFEEMSERKDAHEVYKDFVPLVLKDANRIGFKLEDELFVNIGGIRERIDGQYRLSNTWKVKPFFYFWDSKSLNTEQIINVPRDKRAGATFEQKIHRGQVEYRIMYRDALNGFVPIDIKLHYDVTPNWHAIFNAGIDQENFQTSNIRATS